VLMKGWSKIKMMNYLSSNLKSLLGNNKIII